MKANEVPDKIYVHETSALELDVKIPYSVKYVRKDVFIEKACSWLENNLQGIVGESIYMEDFRKYMEGE